MSTSAEERTYVPYTPQDLDEKFNDGDPFESSEAPGGARENTRFNVKYANGDIYTESYGTDAGEKIVGDQTTYNMIWAFGGDDFVDLEGAKGDSFVSGNDGHDVLIGGDSRDLLHGGADNDDLRGNAGDDFLTGGSGNDYLDGGAGADGLRGGMGNDTFVFRAGDGQDVIRDFEISSDVIEIVVDRRSELDSEIFWDKSSKFLGVDALTFELKNDDDGSFVRVRPNFRSKTVADDSYFDVAGFFSGSEKDGAAEMLRRDGHFRSRRVEELEGEVITIISGSDLGEHIGGSNGKDEIDGGAGDDTIDGGKGDDDFVDIQDEGADTYVFRPGDGRDTFQGFGIHDFQHGVLKRTEKGEDRKEGEVSVVKVDDGQDPHYFVVTYGAVGSEEDSIRIYNSLVNDAEFIQLIF